MEVFLCDPSWLHWMKTFWNKLKETQITPYDVQHNNHLFIYNLFHIEKETEICQRGFATLKYTHSYDHVDD